MRIHDDGKVGIGTTAPNEALTVLGDISASGNIFAKEVIINRQDAGNPGLQVYHATENLLVQLESGDNEVMIDFKDNSTTDNVLMGGRGNDFQRAANKHRRSKL